MALKMQFLLVALLVATVSFAGRVEAQRPAVTLSCFVANCATCSLRNPYVCTACKTELGYKLTSSYGCNSCAVNYEQNLDSPTFTCTKCPAGTASPGGTGLASECVPISGTTGRRLFADADEDLWA